MSRQLKATTFSHDTKQKPGKAREVIKIGSKKPRLREMYGGIIEVKKYSYKKKLQK